MSPSRKVAMKFSVGWIGCGAPAKKGRTAQRISLASGDVAGNEAKRMTIPAKAMMGGAPDSVASARRPAS